MARRSLLRTAAVGATVLLLCGLAGGAWFVARHRHAEPTTASAADATFTLLHARFDGQRPLLIMGLRRAVLDPGTAHASGPLHTFHTVIYDTRGGERLVHVKVPYWFGRLFARHDGSFRWLGELTFLDDTEFDAEQITLSLADIERRGPGLLVDSRHPTGGWFLAWVE